MNYKIAGIATLLLAMISAALFAQEVTGDWISDVDPINNRPAKTIYEFNVEGSKLTGSVLFGWSEEERPITNGKIKDDRISFTLQSLLSFAGPHPRSYALVYLYEGKISGDTINFTVSYGTHTKSKFTARKSNQ